MTAAENAFTDNESIENDRDDAEASAPQSLEPSLDLHTPMMQQ